MIKSTFVKKGLIIVILIGCIAFIGYKYLVSKEHIVPDKKPPVSNTTTTDKIASANYDKDCNIAIVLENKQTVTIQTKFKERGITKCDMPVQISPDKKYVAFELSDVTNFLGVYFASKHAYAKVWGIGAANITDLVFRPQSCLAAEGTYIDGNDKSKTRLRFDLAYIEDNFDTLVNKTTKELPAENDAWTVDDDPTSDNRQSLTFADGKISVIYDAYDKPQQYSKQSTFEEYLMSQDDHNKFWVRYYQEYQQFLNHWPVQKVNSDGTNPGQGEMIFPDGFDIGDAVFYKRISYYNPIEKTKTGDYNNEYSIINNAACLTRLANGGVLYFFAQPHIEGMDVCQLVVATQTKVQTKL